MKCVDVQERLWQAEEMTAEMWEHLKNCRACRQEQDMLGTIGKVMERIDIPTPSRSLLPNYKQIEQAITHRKRKRYAQWLTTGVAAACALVVATQVVPWGHSPSVSPTTSKTQTTASNFGVSNGPVANSTGSENPTAQDNLQKVDWQQPAAPTASVQEQITQLLKKYGWTANLNGDKQQKVQILTSSQDSFGQFPLGLFWAYHNVLSQDIGLDMTAYSGQSAIAHIVPLNQDWSDGPPSGQTTAVLIEANGKIVGAWLQKGLDGGYAASLQKHYFADLVQTTWGHWLVQNGLENVSQGQEAQMKDWAPAQVVSEYFNAINNKDYNEAYGLYSKANQFQYLQMNLASDQVVSNSWEPILGLGLSNIVSAKVEKIADADDYFMPNSNQAVGGPDKLMNRHPYQQKLLEVTVDLKLKQITGYNNGPNTRFFRMVKETPESPWQIDGIGSAP